MHWMKAAFFALLRAMQGKQIQQQAHGKMLALGTTKGSTA